jgi:hypothetical protein
VYPLDEKINLQIIDEQRSRYTQVFSQNAAQLYAELTEEEAVGTLERLLGVKIEKASLSKLAQSVAKGYIISTQETEKSSVLSEKDTTETTEVKMCCENGGEAGFLAQKLEELNERPDRDIVIQNAIDGKLEGVENGIPTKTVMYALVDGTGVPGLKKELSANGKSGGKARTFESKIGCVFQQGFNEGGLPTLSGNDIFRIPCTSKYTGTVNKIDMFDPQFTNFADSHGINTADQIVFLGDGAPWIWNMQKRRFPNAICVIDFFHATEHLNDIVDGLRFHSADKREDFRAECYHLLELGEIDKLALLIRNKANTPNAKKIDDRLRYFTDNVDKMRYGLFRAAGLFIGSGVIEAACKTIVGKRMKNAGMHWSKKNAEGVIALRCAISSGEYGSDKTHATAS